MLSILLKPFLNRDKKVGGKPELHPDTELSLSLIDSGCLFVLIDNKIALIIKASHDDIQIMKEFQAITVEFELIERPEFPSLAFYLNLEAKGGRSFRYEYFFSTESADEMEILRKMCGDKRFDIILYDSGVEFVIRTEIPERQAHELRSLLTKAGGSLTNMPLP
ncbi:MAG TPA: hypothetical protein VLG45_01945 [Thermodesulfobacteriota bacterium]|nr:hypothetical protein [Thermodesulfobacteriota bacterium]